MREYIARHVVESGYLSLVALSRLFGPTKEWDINRRTHRDKRPLNCLPLALHHILLLLIIQHRTFSLPPPLPFLERVSDGSYAQDMCSVSLFLSLVGGKARCLFEEVNPVCCP